jgi:histidyl-tRNA synthetase
MKKIEAKILKGTRDFTPLDMAKRNLVMKKIRKIFERFGYDQIETPIINPAETILGKYGDEGNRLTYNFDDAGGRRIALPFDLTVPFARYYAANWQDLPRPFKRYQIQRVWRAEKPQKGRLREFYQCDIDTIGTKNLIADAETVKVVVEVLKELNFKFRVKINSRRLINEILKSLKVPEEKFISVITIIDKLEKIGEREVLKELSDLPNPEKILKAIKPKSTTQETLANLSNYDLSEINEFLANCKALGIDDKYIEFDPSLARGLDYYTGMVFEGVSENSDFGTLCGGGRYDNLCGIFCKEDFSGVGVAFGFERIMLLLEEMGELNDIALNSKALITIFDKESKEDSLQVYADLAESGVNCEVYPDLESLRKQFKFANKKGIPFVIIRGPEEVEKKEVTIKFMKSGKQKTIPLNQLSNYIINYYENPNRNSEERTLDAKKSQDPAVSSWRY